ncbi:hypothetical protein JTE90_005842 [Oedothorax gibbosus]|uniref:Uncharacterized protein n=1 Tax=Oedothorax gibbosus TaxID=931172 RepID=A0AAV6V3H3_9ARAC|nr:hypothetical protein JTE90_005842 [Oedothorax gibbosus]
MQPPATAFNRIISLSGLGQSVNEKNNPSINRKSTDHCPVVLRPDNRINSFTGLRGSKANGMSAKCNYAIGGGYLLKMNEGLLQVDINECILLRGYD